MVKEELEQFARTNPNFKCFFSVDKAETEGWTGFTGFINDEKIKSTLPTDVSNTLFAACGPPVMVNIVEKILTSKFNVKSNRFFRF